MEKERLIFILPPENLLEITSSMILETKKVL
jgi:hypothetical protein